MTPWQAAVASPLQGRACDVAWPSRLVATAFPSVGTASSVHRSASQLAVALGGLAFTAGSSSLQEMEKQGGCMMCLLVLADGRGFNKRAESHQDETPCKEPP